MARTDSTQPLLPLFEPACRTCPYQHLGRCDGPETDADLLPADRVAGSQKRIDCIDPIRQTEFFTNLHARTPTLIGDIKSPRDLPSFIPILESGMPVDVSLPEDRLYAVGLSHVMSRHGRVAYRSPESIRRNLQLSMKARVCVLGGVGDGVIERAWSRLNKIDLWRDLARLRFDFATSMTYSVWGDNHRFTQLYNIDRNFGSMSFLAEQDQLVLPIFFCPREADYKHAVSWLRSMGNISAIGLLTQCVKELGHLREIVEGTLRLEESVDRTLQPLFIGTSKAEHIEYIASRFRNFSIACTFPVSVGRSGRLLGEDLLVRDGYELLRGRLVQQNIETFEAYCSGLRPIDPGTGLRKLVGASLRGEESVDAGH